MIDISVNYLGLSLRSPFIAASSGYTADIDKMIALAHSGVGAIVLKSLFEEQINSEADFIQSQSVEYPENADFINRYVTAHSVEKYITLIKEAKKKCGIPIIGSINCFSSGKWTEFAREIEGAGADAIEVNIYSLPVSPFKSSIEIENTYKEIVKDISKSVKIPVSVKIGCEFTNLAQFVSSLRSYGASGVTLFNRFYMPDISLKSLKIVPASPFSGKHEYIKELRWIAIISALVRKLDLSASTGVHDTNSAIKLLLSGAKTVQLCSVLYQQGPFVVATFIEELKWFMECKGFKKMSDFIGLLNYSQIEHPEMFERVQFLKVAEKQK